nr:hypothetical protein CFP56_49252 [Quercus suber]
MVQEKGPDDGLRRSLIPPVGNSDETGTNIDGLENAMYNSHNQMQVDFSRVIMGIKAVDQVSLVPNSNYPTGSIEVSNKEDISTETKGQSLIDLKMSRELSLEPKVTKLISTNEQKFSFDMGWVENSPLRKGMLTKTWGKEKGKLTRPGIMSAQALMDHDQFLKQGLKRKGDALSEDSTELWEKEKRLKRNEDVGDFNELVSDAEKEGGSSCPRWQMKNFTDILNWCGLRDMGFVGPQFTWLYQTVVEVRSEKGWIEPWCCWLGVNGLKKPEFVTFQTQHRIILLFFYISS